MPGTPSLQAGWHVGGSCSTAPWRSQPGPDVKVPVTIKAARTKVAQLTGRSDSTFWFGAYFCLKMRCQRLIGHSPSDARVTNIELETRLGETGWSSPQSPSLSGGLGRLLRA